MFCPKCGSQNPDGAAFCGDCGAPFAVNRPVVISPVTTSAPFTGQSLPVSDGTIALAAHKTGRTLGIAVAAVAVVVVVALVAIAISTRGFGLMSPSIKSSTDDYTWDELSLISSEIAKASSENEAIEIAKKYNLVNSDGKLDGTQTKFITLTNGKSVQVQIAGFYHDNKTDGGKAGITFIFENAITDQQKMNSNDTNAGGWKDSELRSWLASDGMNLLPEKLRSKIVAVDKMTNNIGETKNASSVTKTSDKLWLFSYVEICGGKPKSEYSSKLAFEYDIYQAEGSEYKLFKDCNVVWNKENDILAKRYDGKLVFWWERSPNPISPKDFSYVSLMGDPNSIWHASVPHEVVPGFCI